MVFLVHVSQRSLCWLRKCNKIPRESRPSLNRVAEDGRAVPPAALSWAFCPLAGSSGHPWVSGGACAHPLFGDCYRRTAANPDRSPRESAAGLWPPLFPPPASPLMVCFSVLVWGFLFGVSAPFYPSEFPLPSLPAVPLAALGLREGPN